MDWLSVFLAAVGGGTLVGVATLLKVKADNRAANAAAAKTEQETGTEMVNQARAVVQMWQELGQQTAQRVKELEERVQVLETSEKAKTDQICELEKTIDAKDRRIRELEREVERLQAEIEVLKEAQGI